MDAQVVAKIVILGKTNSGKTCLLERYLHGRYVESLESTIGAAFGSRTVHINDTRVTLGIWDTAGSERYDAMSRVYYRGAKAAIICYDLTDESSFYKAKFWVNELQTYEEKYRTSRVCLTWKPLVSVRIAINLCKEQKKINEADVPKIEIFASNFPLRQRRKNCRIYLCGTKLDIFNANSTRGKSLTAAVHEYAEEINAKVFETSSKTGHGVESSFFTVAEDCAKAENKNENKPKDNDVCKLTQEDTKNKLSKKNRCCSK